MSAMELSPQAVAAATFRTVKRGYDPDEVRAYLIEVSASLEASHQQATAMEARARAAIAKLQDATQQAQAAQSSGQVPVTPAVVPSEEAETISRTLLLAQRTADTAIAEAQAQAKEITQAAQAEAAGVSSAAKQEAASTLEQARAEAARVLDDARAEAERAKSEAHVRAETEVRELESRRSQLVADLDALERANTAHRDQLRELAAAISGIADSMPAAIERPTLSPSSSSSNSSSASSAGVNGEITGGFDRPSGQVPVTSLTAGPMNGEDTGGHRIPPPPITGQVPLQPGVEPLVSPRPTSADEVRSMWQQAELAERAELAGRTQDTDLIDATPVDGLDGVSADAPTPTEGFRR